MAKSKLVQSKAAKKDAEQAFQARYDAAIKSISEKYHALYGADEKMFGSLQEIIRDAFSARKKGLKANDLKREADSSWFLSHNVVATSVYVDLFAGDLNGFGENIDYLKDLGINLVHFMPLLKTRDGADDGGFAVSSYTEINPKLGTMAEFEKVNDRLRAAGIATCIDFVANHTAKEHEWAERARAGEKEYQDMYHMFDNYDIPAEYEKNLVSTFPELAPGNFTYQNDLKKWVFTTFYDFQWDLNYQNPFTFNNIIKDLLFLLNRGVDVVRVDAIRHIWKEVGTNCSNLPQVHIIVSLMKTIVNTVCPGVIFLGEAVTSQKNVLEYFGAKQNGCELMYNITFMSGLWSSLATRDVRYMRHCLQNSPHLPEGVCWMNYIRCHDDADFIIEDDEIRAVGLEPFWHKQFLIDFYIGKFPGSFARGEIYSYDHATKNARVSGTLASMCGLEKGLHEHDRFQVDYAYRRMLLLYGVLLAYSGIPIIYSGDEIASLNDYSYKQDAEKAVDSRWLHRTKFDWRRLDLRHNMTTSEGIIFSGLKKLIGIRKDEPLFNSSLPMLAFDTWNNGVFGGYKRSGEGTFLLLANFAEHYQYVDVAALKNAGFDGVFTDLLHGRKLDLNSTAIYLNPYEFFWLKQ
jgi:amylosucrase